MIHITKQMSNDPTTKMYAKQVREAKDSLKMCLGSLIIFLLLSLFSYSMLNSGCNDYKMTCVLSPKIMDHIMVPGHCFIKIHGTDMKPEEHILSSYNYRKCIEGAKIPCYTVKDPSNPDKYHDDKQLFLLCHHEGYAIILICSTIMSVTMCLLTLMSYFIYSGAKRNLASETKRNN